MPMCYAHTAGPPMWLGVSTGSCCLHTTLTCCMIVLAGVSLQLLALTAQSDLVLFTAWAVGPQMAASGDNEGTWYLHDAVHIANHSSG